jgi:TatD DNase family protein
MPTVKFIDTHAHLDDDQFRNELDAVIERALAADVSHIVSIATTAASSTATIEIALRHQSVSATVGIQPNNIAQAATGDWDIVWKLVPHERVVAIGETGLDRHWDYTPFAQQEDYFNRHLELARKHKLPVVIHCRKTEADVLRMLRADYERSGPVKGVMHSFTGDLATAEACLELGLYISFAGMVTYKNAQNLRDVAARIPLDRLLIETDCPYLAPVPLRGRRNEPANVVHTAACLCGLHQVDVQVLAEQTSHNARVLFGIRP